MKKNIFILILLTAAFQTLAQSSVTFQSVIKPNKTYISTTIISSVSEVDFKGNEQRINDIKAGGVTLPLMVTGASEIVTTAVTSSVEADKSFRGRTIFDKASTSQKVGDKEVKDDKSMVGVIMDVIYKDGKVLRIDTIISQTLDDQTRGIVRSMLGNIQDKINFPAKPMSIGDSFKQEFPMQIPMPGINPVQLTVITNYKLIDIKNNKAMFTFTQEVSLDMTVEQAKLSEKGEGVGKSEFDILNSIITKYESDLTMSLILPVNDLTIEAKINAKSNLEVKVK